MPTRAGCCANRSAGTSGSPARPCTRPNGARSPAPGKRDSAWALHEARRSGDYDVVGGLTTVTDTFARVSMHGVREALLLSQLDAAGLEPIIVRIPYPCPNEIYEREMAMAIEAAKARGVTHVIFGDLFLEDVRAYRERQLAGTGITPVFPLWQRPTAALAREMIAAGVQAHLAVVDLKKLPAGFAGRRYDADLLDEFPVDADPCGENGEFHSFVSAGPMLKDRIAVSVGETVERDGFAFADLLAA
jgi:diphthamide synthase (EF-2-diphthine--ammonia ligase)